MRSLLILSALILAGVAGLGQSKYFTKTGKISFYSKSALETIAAVNNKLFCVWDAAGGQIELGVLMKGFDFEKALMQEHFNEDYVESDKYPKANFKGIIENSNPLFLTKNNQTTVKVSGNLTLHGVTKPVNTTALITVKGGVISAVATFVIVLVDYNISIPFVVADKINKTIAVTISISAFQLLAAK